MYRPQILCCYNCETFKNRSRCRKHTCTLVMNPLPFQGGTWVYPVGVYNHHLDRSHCWNVHVHLPVRSYPPPLQERWWQVISFSIYFTVVSFNHPVCFFLLLFMFLLILCKLFFCLEWQRSMVNKPLVGKNYDFSIVSWLWTPSCPGTKEHASLCDCAEMNKGKGMMTTHKNSKQA